MEVYLTLKPTILNCMNIISTIENPVDQIIYSRIPITQRLLKYMMLNFSFLILLPWLISSFLTYSSFM